MEAMTTTELDVAHEAPADAEARYARKLGAQLRRVRQQQQLSLLDVERLSKGRFKASVLGAYERGERTVSMARLDRLAGFYRVPVTALLPSPPPLVAVETDDPIVDLSALERHREDEPVVFRYVSALQSRRGDYNGRVLTVRKADLDTLAAVLDAVPAVLRDRLAAAGILR